MVSSFHIQQHLAETAIPVVLETIGDLVEQRTLITIVGSFRLEYEYEIEYNFSNLERILKMIK